MRNYMMEPRRLGTREMAVETDVDDGLFPIVDAAIKPHKPFWSF